MASPPQSVQVVIVGAGLSGLRAAREVHEAGLSYVVLEAMDHVGGKTLSVPAAQGAKGVIDMGAAWINDTSQSEIYSLAKEFGFDLVEQRTEGNNLYRDEKGEVHCIPFGMPANASSQKNHGLQTLTLYSLSRHKSSKSNSSCIPLQSMLIDATLTTLPKRQTQSVSIQ